jgi:hypothetical protein
MDISFYIYIFYIYASAQPYHCVCEWLTRGAAGKPPCRKLNWGSYTAVKGISDPEGHSTYGCGAMRPHRAACVTSPAKDISYVLHI